MAQETGKPRVILLIAEQNIEGPQRAWWMSEIDLSTTETTIAKALIEKGYTIIEPTAANKEVRKEAAFKRADLSEPQSLRLGRSTKADYVVLGKAVASSGGKVPASSMVSCFANITVKVIRVKDGQVIAYLDSSGKSVHTDKVTGGKEALSRAASDLAGQLIQKF
jgi:hypothetical protein